MTDLSPNWDDIFHDRGSRGEFAQNSCRVVYVRGTTIQADGELEAELGKLQLGQQLVVVHTISGLGMLRRLATLCLRESLVTKLETLLREHGRIAWTFIAPIRR